MNISNSSLNSLFTVDEFKFVNTINSDINTFNSILSKEMVYNNYILKLIDHLKTFATSLEDNELMLSSSNILELISRNIDLIHNVQQTFDKLNPQIVNLLVEVELYDENKAENKILDDISRIKEEINNSNYLTNNFREDIIETQKQIENFMQRDDVKNILSSLSINLSGDQEQINSSNENIPVSENSNSLEPIDESNDTLLFLEKNHKVYLPYSKKEVLAYLTQYPNQYKSFRDVVEKEFVFSVDFYMKHPVVARFRETYSLIRDRESKSILEAFKYAMDLMLRRDLNPAIIASCKSQDQLEDYLECLSSGNLAAFTAFKIQFEVTPLPV